MLNEDNVRAIYERKVRLYAKTGSDKYLWQMEVLGQILEVTAKEEEQLLQNAIAHQAEIYEKD